MRAEGQLGGVEAERLRDRGFDCGGMLVLWATSASRRTRIVEISTAPIVAVPKEMPIWRNVFATPDASPASSTRAPPTA